MARPHILAWAAFGLAAVALGGAPGDKNRTSAQVSEKSVEDEIEEERARLHQNVQKAVPVSHDTKRVNMWKTARPAAAKVQEAAAVSAGDWADADISEDHTTQKKPTAYDSNADEVEQQRAQLSKGGRRAPASAETSTTTKRKTAKPASEKVKAAAKVQAGDWANADEAEQPSTRQPAAETAAKSDAVKTPAIKPAAEETRAAKLAAEDVPAAAAEPKGRKASKEPRRAEARPAKKLAAKIRRKSHK